MLKNQIGVKIGVLVEYQIREVDKKTQYIGPGLTPGPTYCVLLGAPGGIRTPDTQFRRLVLYPLSYWRINIGVRKGIRTLDLQGHNLAP